MKDASLLYIYQIQIVSDVFWQVWKAVCRGNQGPSEYQMTGDTRDLIDLPLLSTFACKGMTSSVMPLFAA